MMWLSYEASSCSVVCKAEGKLLMHLSCSIWLFISWTCFSWYKSVLYFIKPQHEIVPPLAPGACCCPPFPSDLTCFTLCEVLYFQLYKAISSSLSTVLGYTCNMMHFSSSLLNMWSCMLSTLQSYIKFAFNYTWLHTCNMMCFSSSLLSITLRIECSIWSCPITHLIVC